MPRACVSAFETLAQMVFVRSKEIRSLAQGCKEQQQLKTAFVRDGRNVPRACSFKQAALSKGTK